MDQKTQLEQDLQQLQQGLTQAREQLANWQARVLKTEGALDLLRMQIARCEAALTGSGEANAPLKDQ